MTSADAAPDLDRQIADVFALLGVLLVFVIAYLSAMFPLVEDAIRQSRPTVEADRLRLSRRLRTYRNLIGGLALTIVLIAVLLLPLSGQAVSGWAWPWQRGYRTTRAGLVVVDLFLLLLLAVSGWQVTRLHRRGGELTSGPG
ncbi:MAG: hypothetical protein JWM18_68 [Chloroflexi bacterium]|nr:hypothetical protein [Chloroflexota bacterium]